MSTPDRRVYTWRLPFDVLRISADLVRADAPIRYAPDAPGWDGDEFVPTPYQTADCRHLECELLAIVVAWLGPGYYATPPRLDETPDEIAERQTLELAAALNAAEPIE